MPRRLFARWQGDVRQAMLDDLAWLGLESALYQRELPCRPALETLRLAHAEGFFSSEYQLSRQEWMEKNPLVYTLQSARWKTVLGQRPPVLPPWEKGFSEALSLSGDLEGDAVEQAILAAFQKYLQFDGTVRRKVPLRLHFDERWAPLLTKLMPVEIVRTDDLVLGRSSQAGQGGMVQAAGLSGPTSAPTSGRRPTGTTSSSASAAASSLPGTWPLSSSAAAPGTTWTAASGTPRALRPRTSRKVRIPSSWPSRRRSRRNGTSPPSGRTASSIRAPWPA